MLYRYDILHVVAASVKTAAVELYRGLSATKWTFMKGSKVINHKQPHIYMCAQKFRE